MSNSGCPQNGGAPPQGLAQPVAAVPVQLNGNPRRFGRRERIAAWFRRGRPRQQVPANSAAGGVELAVVPEEAQARSSAMPLSHDQAPAADVDAALLNDPANGHGLDIHEMVGCFMGQDFHNRADGTQNFAGIDEGTAAFLASAPAIRLMPAGAAGPGVRVGRIIGCAQTGRVLVGGRVQQNYGYPQPAQSNERQGYSVIAPARSSNMRAMGRGQALGGNPSVSAYAPQRVGRA